MRNDQIFVLLLVILLPMSGCFDGAVGDAEGTDDTSSGNHVINNYYNNTTVVQTGNTNYEFIIKKAYLEGALDGRLFSYLKTWENDKDIADNVFSETVDYLTIRELIKNIDYFYNDPMNSYIPIPSAILIANMYAKRMNMENIDFYIKSSRKWINELTLELDTLNYSKLLEQKVTKQNND